MSTANQTMLGELLNSRLDIFQMRQEPFKHGYKVVAQVVPSCRFILFAGGKARYQIEQATTICTQGTALFVPPWVWRKWEVVSEEPVEMLWTVFAPTQRIFNEIGHGIVHQPEDFSLLQASLQRMFNDWPHRNDLSLLLEGELKAALARFFLKAPSSEDQEDTGRHKEVDFAIRWLQAHYDEPGALSQMQQQLTLHPDYFRNLFREQVHQSPNQYLTMLRMRAARHFLRETGLNVKEVAAKTGFQDPLYFSRSYRKFWHCTPSDEQH